MLPCEYIVCDWLVVLCAGSMESVFILLLLLVHTSVVLVENVGGTCEHQHDAMECDGSSDEASHKYTTDENVEIDQ